MRWRKVDQIFAPSDNFGWMKSHAQIPTVLNLGSKLRIYFSTRTVSTESKTTFLDVDAKNPSKIIYLHDRPILSNGSPGTFDEHGVMPSSVLTDRRGKIRLYYSGWSRRTTVPYSNFAGLALSDDGIHFERMGDGPILSMNLHEPYSATSPFILTERGKFYAFYCSGTGWLKVNDQYEHTYDIKMAVSEDGIYWSQNGKQCFPKKHAQEAITRPVVLKIQNTYHMWFCYRGSLDFRDGVDAYRIGYAYSYDLKSWERNDSMAGIDVSPKGWDSGMLAYPYIVKTDHATYMFYNGNGFGKSGLGYATLEE
jgi:hypothetical protein